MKNNMKGKAFTAQEVQAIILGQSNRKRNKYGKILFTDEVREAMEKLKYHSQIQYYFNKELGLEDIKDAAKDLLNVLESMDKSNIPEKGDCGIVEHATGIFDKNGHEIYIGDFVRWGIHEGVIKRDFGNIFIDNGSNSILSLTSFMAPKIEIIVDPHRARWSGNNQAEEKTRMMTNLEIKEYMDEALAEEKESDKCKSCGKELDMTRRVVVNHGDKGAFCSFDCANQAEKDCELEQAADKWNAEMIKKKISAFGADNCYCDRVNKHNNSDAILPCSPCLNKAIGDAVNEANREENKSEEEKIIYSAGTGLTLTEKYKPSKEVLEFIKQKTGAETVGQLGKFLRCNVNIYHVNNPIEKMGSGEINRIAKQLGFKEEEKPKSIWKDVKELPKDIVTPWIFVRGRDGKIGLSGVQWQLDEDDNPINIELMEPNFFDKQGVDGIEYCDITVLFNEYEQEKQERIKLKERVRKLEEKK